MKAIFLYEYSAIQYLLGTIVMLWGIYFWKVVYNFWDCHVKLLKAVEHFPGPPTIPLLGNAWEFASNVKDSMNVMIKFGKIYPTYRIWIGPRLIIVVTTPEDIEIVTKSSKTAKKSYAYKFMEPVVINSMINGYGPKMRANRKLQEPMINGKCLSNYMEIFNKQVRRYVDTLAIKADMGEFDIYHESECCVADIAFETMAGIPGVAQDHGDLTFPYAVETAIDILYQRIVTPWLQPLFFFNLSRRGRRFNAALKLADEYLRKIINEKRELYMTLARNKSEMVKQKSSILDQLIENVVKTNAMNDQEIVSDFIALFVGFYDGILGIFSFMMLMLAMHPNAQEKVRNEVMSVMEADSDVVDENIGKLKYIHMVIKETIRLFPVGPFLAREVTDDLQLGDYTLPKGSTVAMMPVITHRSEKYWDEPEKFIPERFLPKNSKNRHPFAYLPFSGGSRTCPGSKFAITCLKVMTAHFIRKYQLMTTMKLESINLTTHISVRSHNGYRVSIKKIEQS